jgi:hypothetical protein
VAAPGDAQAPVRKSLCLALNRPQTTRPYLMKSGNPPHQCPQNPAMAASPSNAPQQSEANNDGSGFKVNPPAHTSIYSRCLADLPDRTAENHTTEATLVMVFFPSLSLSSCMANLGMLMAEFNRRRQGRLFMVPGEGVRETRRW